MNKIFTLLLILLNVQVFAQRQVEVIESYIIDQKIENKLSKNGIENNRFKQILMNDYYNRTFEKYIYDDELQNYLIIKNEFDLNNIDLLNLKKHKFLLTHKVLKNTKREFSNVFFSKNGNYAIFYEEETCKGLCGGGNLVLMELISGEWNFKSILYSWVG